MPAKTTKKMADSEIKMLALDAAMSEAAEIGWDRVTMRAVASRADLPVSALFSSFEDKDDILAFLGRVVDEAALDNVPEDNADFSVRDCLFDLLMDRYDALNNYRGGVCAVLDSFKGDPKQAVIACPYLCRSMNLMLEAAHVETSGLRGVAKVAGLTGLYLKVLRVWKNDDSPDLSKTMAALDKALGRAEGLVVRLGI